MIDRPILLLAALVVVSGCSSPGSPSDRAAPQANIPRAHSARTASALGQDAGLSTLSVSDSGSEDPDAALSAFGTSAVLATLRNIGLAAASVAGVSSPTRMVAVAAADHKAAESILSGAIVNDHVPVYVILLAGGPFTATQHPPGVPAPQGSFLRVSVEAATFRVTDVGYVNVEPDLSQIGSTVVNLLAQ